MFFGRERELKNLNMLYSSGKFEMAIIYGRRRVGKTTLINEFCKDKKTIFFSAFESTEQANLVAFSNSILTLTLNGSNSTPVFGNFSQAFEHVNEISRDERIVMVIDEYPYLANSEPSISSVLQNYIDHKFKNSKLFIILCGSSMSFMENQVLGYKSPLYGRRTAQFKILPFDYLTTANWVKRYSFENQAIVYGVTGGVPLYVEKFKDTISIKKNLLESLFEQNAFLFEEPSNLLKQELREPQKYNAIITAIANGSSKLNEIATKSGIENSGCVNYLKNLISLGIVRKESPVTEKESKKTIYQIDDNLFRFWYRFVPANMASIASEKICESYDRSIEPFISEYMGIVFEQICKDYLLYRRKKLPISLGQIGQWWGTNPNRKIQAQIDIVLTSPDEKQAIFAECKYRNEKMDEDILDRLIENAALLKGIEKKHYFLFSKSGFSNKLILRAKREKVVLVTLEDLFQV